MKFKVGTWNIAAGRKIRSLDWMDYSNEDIDYFYSHLKQLDLDIICLQESQFNSETSFAKQLAVLLGFGTVQETTGCPSHIDKNFSMTPAIISKFEITESKIFVLPYPKFPLVRNGKEFPPFDRYAIKASFGDFCVVTVHPEPLGAFGADYESGAGRELAEAIDATLLNKLQKPVILAADFNFENIHNVLPKTTHDLALKEVFSGETTKPQGGHPDHIAYSSEFAAIDSGIVKTETDHYLCWAEFEI